MNNEERRIRIDDDWLRSRFEAGLTAAEIANEKGCSTHPINKAMRRLGLRRKAARRPGNAVGKNNPSWRGGRRTRKDGYVLVWTPEGERLEHRCITEIVLGRRLQPAEIVHHKNGIKDDNRIDNLEVMDQAEHARHHSPEMHAARYGK